MAVLDVQNLTLSFGERTLFAGVSFSIKEREKVGFVGANGVGKTSLFKVICGDYTPDSGGAFLSKNCKLGYMEQHTCSAGNTVWNELVSVFAPLMELERQLEEVGDRLRSGQGDTAADIALQDRLTEQFQREGGLAYNDPEIGIDWPFEEGVELIISEKDKKWSGLKDTFKFNEEN